MPEITGTLMVRVVGHWDDPAGGRKVHLAIVMADPTTQEPVCSLADLLLSAGESCTFQGVSLTARVECV